MTNSRAKGARGELEVRDILRAHGYPNAKRRLAGNGQAGDIDGGPDGWIIEVKHQARAAWCLLPVWWAQAVAETPVGMSTCLAVRAPASQPYGPTWLAFTERSGLYVGQILQARSNPDHVVGAMASYGRARIFAGTELLDIEPFVDWLTTTKDTTT